MDIGDTKKCNFTTDIFNMFVNRFRNSNVRVF